jgi:site-specific recombinase XerD
MANGNSLSPAAMSFLEGLDAADGTKLAYRAALSKFESLKIPLDANSFSDFNARLKRQKFAPSTRQLYLSALRRFIAHRVTHGDQIDLVAAEVRLKDRRGKTREGYKHKQAPAQLPDVVNYFDAEPSIQNNDKWTAQLKLEWLRNRALMHTLYASAGRISEVLSLTRKDVAGGQAVEVLITGKGDKQRMLFLTPEAQSAIRAYCDSRDDAFPALFISHRRGKGGGLTRESGWRIIKTAGKACNVPNVSPHMFRHYRATQLLNEGMPLESVQAYLGHASPETTRVVYAHSKTRVIREQLAEYGLSPKEATRGG